MHPITHILSEFDYPTNKLKIGALRANLPSLQEHCKYQKHSVELWNEALDKLWTHMNAEVNIKCRMLCATYFYTILSVSDKREVYLNEILRIVQNQIIVMENTDNTSMAVALINGMFQSSLFSQVSNKSGTMEQILDAVFEFLLLLGYKYSEHTVIAFKTLSSFRKILGTHFQENLFSRKKQIKLLNLINHNWENPMTGVRDLNGTVFQILLSVMEASMCESVLKEINAFYWNKAKYLMISEFMKNTSSILSTQHMEEWVDGLLYSLNKPGLVSAGADMYFALLKNLNHENEWSDLFLTKLVNVFINQSKKTIENFTNYWCLITLQKFPSLMQVLIDELENKGNTEMVKYSILCILKQGNKKGLYYKKLNLMEENVGGIDALVVKALEDCDPMTRMLAFDIVCVSSHKVTPNEIECGFVVSYLNNNMNSDCAVLRLNMVNSLSIFLIRIHKYFLNCSKRKEEDEMKRILQFCNELQEIIFVSLNFNGNYQRKITLIKLCDAILSTFEKMPDKPKFLVVQSAETLEKYLKGENNGIMYTETFLFKLIELLKDPADDIRMCIVKLLLNHYSSEIKQTRFLNNIIDNALLSINNKFFYQINCGQSMFKLIVSILVKEKFLEAKFKTVESIFKFGCNELKSEYILNRDIVESIELGRQLHSFVSILQVVIEVCLNSSYRMEVARDDILEVIDILEAISKQFSWEEDGTTSSDFSKMSDMIETIIAKSTYSDNYTIDESKTSGLHQIVLNSLWLNVKASCDVSAALIQYYKNDVDTTICKKCLDIITNVLETSRHKGAIEAAGVALGQSIRYLTSLPETSGVSHIPRELLHCKLKELISETSRMSSVTRRGAGLSIMVHRIVSNDMEEGKPLFHYFINAVLETCSSSKDELGETCNSDVEDLPKAIYIHFLTRIVMDSTLASDVLYYAAKLAELAFDNLTSIHWQIRNAALQLYGALVPKLIGQKKASGTDNNTIATVACDEFRLHFPKLWVYMRNQLQNNNCTNILQSHNNLIPILNITASFARRYNFSSDTLQQKTSDDILLKDLLKFLGSPIYTVRRLSAKSIFNIFTFEEIHYTLMQEDVVSDNFLHGCLMLATNCLQQYNSTLCNNYFSKLKEKFTCVINLRKHSYLCKLSFENVFDESTDFSINNLKKVLMEVKTNSHAPGVHVWAETLVKKYIKLAPWELLPDILKLLLEENCFEKHGESLLEKIESDKDIQEDILEQMFYSLFMYKHKFDCGILWLILYKISANVNVNETIDIKDLFQNLKSSKCIYKIRYMLPFLTRICVSFKHENQMLLNLSQQILSMSSPEMTDFEMRYIAAIANNEIANKLKMLPDSITVNAIKTAVVLLQDEDEDIRNVSVNFYKNARKTDAPHPYICLQNILNYKFLNDYLNKPTIRIKICNDLSSILLNTSQDISDQYNPFANSSKNIYLEVKVVKKLIENLKDT